VEKNGTPNSDYRFTSKVGDVVRMKGGTLAIVSDTEILCAGHAKELTLFPLTGIAHRIFLFLTMQLRPVEDEINQLTCVGNIDIAQGLL